MNAANNRGPDRLFWTDYWYLAATVIAAAVAVDPLEWGLASETLVKHLALMVSLPALGLTLVGSNLFARSRQRASFADIAAVLWPLLALAAIIVGGSLYARVARDIQNSFLNVGLYMLTACSAAVMVIRSGAPEALARAHVRVLLVFAVVMAGYLIANFGVRQVYHEQIFLVIPMAVLLFAGGKSLFARWAGCLFFLLMAWLSAKYTSYLIGIMTCAYLALAVVIPRMAPRSGLQRTMLVYWACLAGAMFGVVVGLYAMQGGADLPTGNVDYRMHTYTAAWDRFVDSPVWGTMFAVEAVEKFTLYSIGVSRNMLATHSDVLDLLANGGLLGIALWIYALAHTAYVVYLNLLQPQFVERPWAPYAHTLAVMSLAGVITYTFNPILLQPALAYLLWTNLGMLAGLALRMKNAGKPQRPMEAKGSFTPRGAYGIAGAEFNARSRT